VRGYTRWKFTRLYHFIFRFATPMDDKPNENIKLKLKNPTKAILKIKKPE
jgi:hypothetical protein